MTKVPPVVSSFAFPLFLPLLLFFFFSCLFSLFFLCCMEYLRGDRVQPPNNEACSGPFVKTIKIVTKWLICTVLAVQLGLFVVHGHSEI